MDILIVGIAGPLFEWAGAGIAAASRLPLVAVGDPGLLAAMPETTAERLCRTNHLTPELAQAARQGRLRVIATCDDPEAGCADWRSSPKPLRAVSAGLFAQADLLGLPNVLWVDRSTSPAAMFAHCRLDAAKFPSPAESPPADDALRELLAPALAYARSGKRITQVWPRDLLLDGDHPDQPLPRVIDLSGPARTLAYGPYLGFSPGPARLSVVLAVAPNCRHAEMAIDLHAGAQLGRGLFLLTQPGIFAAEIDVLIPSAREALEIRLKSERGAIEGAIGIDHVKLTPHT